jgi:hypothetical protein
MVRPFAALISLLGALTLVEHLAGINLGIDTLLFDEAPGAVATTAPGRMGPPASISFLLLGAGLLLLGGGGARAALGQRRRDRSHRDLGAGHHWTRLWRERGLRDRAGHRRRAADRDDDRRAGRRADGGRARARSAGGAAGRPA